MEGNLLSELLGELLVVQFLRWSMRRWCCLLLMLLRGPRMLRLHACQTHLRTALTLPRVWADAVGTEYGEREQYSTS